MGNTYVKTKDLTQLPNGIPVEKSLLARKTLYSASALQTLRIYESTETVSLKKMEQIVTTMHVHCAVASSEIISLVTLF